MPETPKELEDFIKKVVFPPQMPQNPTALEQYIRDVMRVTPQRQ